MYKLVLGLGVVVGLSWPGAATAQPLIPTPAPVPPPVWSAALDAYGGYGLLFTSDQIESHALGGGLTRLRYRYLQLGAVIFLCLSTVYCRYHYVVDVFAGVAAAALMLPLGEYLYRRLR